MGVPMASNGSSLSYATVPAPMFPLARCVRDERWPRRQKTQARMENISPGHRIAEFVVNASVLDRHECDRRFYRDRLAAALDRERLGLAFFG
jgi:hypothetical protein